MSDIYTRKMLSEIRKRINESSAITELPGKTTILEQDNSNSQEFIPITTSDVQFGSVRNSQEEALRKTIGDVSLKPDALKYYPNIQDIVLNGEISGLGVSFQFRYKDPSGDGCYVWSEGLQMTDANLRTIQKIRDAFLNWKQSLVEDGDLLQKLDKEANKNR